MKKPCRRRVIGAYDDTSRRVFIHRSMCDHPASTLPISFPVVASAAPVDALTGQDAPCRLAQNAREDGAGQWMGERIIPGDAHIFIDTGAVRQQGGKAQRGGGSDLNRRHALLVPSASVPPCQQREQGQEKGKNRRYRQAKELQ